MGVTPATTLEAGTLSADVLNDVDVDDIELERMKAEVAADELTVLFVPCHALYCSSSERILSSIDIAPLGSEPLADSGSAFTVVASVPLADETES